MPTRQTSSSGRPKSPRIQVVLPEDLCQRLSVLAEDESRTVSNMAKVLIQQGVERLEQQRQSLQEGVVDRGRGNPSPTASSPTSTSGQASPAASPSHSAPPASPPPTTERALQDQRGSDPVPGSQAAADRFRAELERNEANR